MSREIRTFPHPLWPGSGTVHPRVGEDPHSCQGFAVALPSLRGNGFFPSSSAGAVRIRMSQAV